MNGTSDGATGIHYFVTAYCAVCDTPIEFGVDNSGKAERDCGYCGSHLWYDVREGVIQ